MNDRKSTRQRHAEHTRREILAAARALFARQGYARTSVAAIAHAAGVSVQTIYDSVGSKAALLRSLNDEIDAVGEVGPLVQQMAATDDAREIVRLVTSISRNISDRCGDIQRAVLAAAGSDSELAAVHAEGMRRHREGVRRTVERLAGLGALRGDVSVEQASAVLGGLCEPAAVYVFVDGYGWTYDEWQQWATDAIARLILA